MILFGGARPTFSKIVEIAYQSRNDSSEMVKDRKRMTPHFNPPSFH